jgi:hypothetical protein
VKRRRHGRHEARRVVLHRTATEAELWAGACKSILRDLEVADWWRVDIIVRLRSRCSALPA